jgi:hypothetical protein
MLFLCRPSSDSVWLTYIAGMHVRLHGGVELIRRYDVVGKFGKTGRGLVVAGTIVAAIGLTMVPRPADADWHGGGWHGGGISPGAAAGIGLGAFALGTAVGNSYSYNPNYYGSYGYPAGGYYPSTPYYPPARSCWNPYYRTYYAC